MKSLHHYQSHPVRVRGLKHTKCETIRLPLVAPRAGAWIETGLGMMYLSNIYVAPRAGAWIETIVLGCNKEDLMSHPVRVRGLKL